MVTAMNILLLWSTEPVKSNQDASSKSLPAKWAAIIQKFSNSEAFIPFGDSLEQIGLTARMSLGRLVMNYLDTNLPPGGEYAPCKFT